MRMYVFVSHLPMLCSDATLSRDLNDADLVEAFKLSEDSDRIRESLHLSLPPLKDAEPVPNVFNIGPSILSSLDVDELVRLRLAHQTKQADSGVRARTNDAEQNLDSNDHGESFKPPSEKQKLLQRLNQIIKEQQDRGVGTRQERDFRWAKSAAGGNETELAGNSANAAAVATASAGKVRRYL